MEKERRTPQTPSFYLPQLDGLRFVAFLLVFIHNAPYVESNKIWLIISEHSWIGVDLFFCLSAFLITKLLVLEYQKNEGINIKNFYARRALRIWPIYFIYILIILLSGFQKQNSAQAIPQLVSLFTFTFNFASISFFPRIISIFAHLWTVSYEWQFYIIIPWFVYKLLKMSEKSRWGIFFFLGMIGWLLRALFIYLSIKHPAIYMLPFMHFEALLGGVVVGSGMLDKKLKKANPSLLLIGGTLFNLATFYLPNIYITSWHLMLTYLLSGLGMTLIVCSAINAKDYFFQKILSNRIFMYLGKISYGLYIFHLTSITLARSAFSLVPNFINPDSKFYSLAIFTLGLCVSILISTISYYSIEQSLLRLKMKFSSIK